MTTSTAPDLTTTCGLFSWRPRWMQRFASPKYYIIVFSIVGLLGPMVFSYLSIALSTIERRFGLQSKEAAWIYSGNEVSQVALFFLLPFVGRVKKRPLWVGLMNVVAAVGVFIIALPQFISPKYTIQQGSGKELCQSSVGEECVETPKDWASMFIIFFGIFITGFANSLYYSFGLPYLDDNSPRQSSPLKLSIAMAARVAGPGVGILLASACLNVYVNPGENPDFNEDHPSWIGAWWLGPLIISVLLFIFGPWLVLFPGKLVVPSSDGDAIKDEDPEPETAKEWLQEFVTVTKRLTSNKIYVLNTVSTVVLLFGLVGFFQFFTKYMEFQFYQNASKAGGIGGIANIAVTVFGIILSGFVMSKYKFTARQVTGYGCFVSLIGIFCFIGIGFISCDRIEVHGLNMSASTASTCISGCYCDNVEYQPVCSMDGVTNFISPCHAGCTSSGKSIEKDSRGRSKTLYYGCACAKDKSLSDGLEVGKPWWVADEEEEEELLQGEDGRPLVPSSSSSSDKYSHYNLDTMVDGYCNTDCSRAFYTMIGTFGVMGIFSSTTRIPGFIVALRAVERRDKASAITLTVTALSLFALLPSPVLFGAIIDSTCTIWSVKCGESRNCLVYDAYSMRMYLVSIIVTFMVAALGFDIATWYYVKDLKLYDHEEEDEKTTKTREANS